MLQILLLVLLTSVSLVSHPRNEKQKLQKEIKVFIEEKNYDQLLIKLEEFIQKYPYEKKYQIYLAKTYLLKSNENIHLEDDPFLKEEKKKKIRNQYEKAQAIYSKLVPEWEGLSPNDRNLGFWYFEWALVEHILGNKEKAISLYKKCSQFHEFPKEAFYNLGILFLELGLEKDAQKQLKKFYSRQGSEN